MASKSVLENNSIDVTINEDEFELIKSAMKELSELDNEEAEKYEIDSKTILTAKDTLERISKHDTYEKVPMNTEEVNNMINALANAYYLYFMHYAEEMESNTETLEEYQKELKESIKTKTEYRNTLKELTEIKEKANDTDNNTPITIALSLIAVVILTVLTLYIH